AGFLRPEGDAGRRRRRGATAGGARHDGRALAPPGRVRARAGRRAVWLADAGWGAWRGAPRPHRRGRRLGGPPPTRSRAGQGDARLAALRGTPQRGGPALAVALVLLALVAPAGRWRWLVVLAAAWCAARAPLGSSLRTAELFSPAAFYRPVLGVFSASAGSLIAAGVVALCAASALWR